MKIALIGATGNVGGCLLDEALRRGHQVTAISRNASALAPRPQMDTVELNITNADALTDVLRGHDVVISSVRFLQASVETLLQPIRESGVRRWLVVGGAGSLMLGDGTLLVDSPNFPEVARPEAMAGHQFLENLKKEADINWTFISPSALFAKGERTGFYRQGQDHLLVDDQGKSRISMEDFAIALLDELEAGQHSRQRITVGY